MINLYLAGAIFMAICLILIYLYKLRFPRYERSRYVISERPKHLSKYFMILTILSLLFGYKVVKEVIKNTTFVVEQSSQGALNMHNRRQIRREIESSMKQRTLSVYAIILSNVEYKNATCGSFGIYITLVMRMIFDAGFIWIWWDICRTLMVFGKREVLGVWVLVFWGAWSWVFEASRAVGTWWKLREYKARLYV